MKRAAPGRMSAAEINFLKEAAASMVNMAFDDLLLVICMVILIKLWLLDLHPGLCHS